jgi:hypothetical protein
MSIKKNECIFIVSTYPNVELKEKLLHDIVTKLKKLGNDVLIASHYALPDYIIEKVNYYIYDSYNMLDVNYNLDTVNADFWMENSSFKLETILSTHMSSISRIFSISLDFVKNLGYKYFVILESDSEIHLDDLNKLSFFTEKTISNNKKMWFCKPKYVEFNWYNKSVYETYTFGGDLDYFLSIFKFPRDYNEWNLLKSSFTHDICFEYMLHSKISKYESDFLILDTAKSELNLSKIDLFSNSNISSVYYNLNDENKPVLFFYNNLHGYGYDNIEYRYVIDCIPKKLSLNENFWYFDFIDISKHNVNVKIETYSNNRLIYHTNEVVSKSNISTKKKLKRILFK